MESYEIHDPNAEVVVKVETPVKIESAMQIFEIKPKIEKKYSRGSSSAVFDYWNLIQKISDINEMGNESGL